MDGKIIEKYGTKNKSTWFQTWNKKAIILFGSQNQRIFPRVYKKMKEYRIALRTIHPTIWGQKAKISDSFLALIKRKLILEPLSRSCHVEVLQKKKLQNPIQFIAID